MQKQVARIAHEDCRETANPWIKSQKTSRRLRRTSGIVGSMVQWNSRAAPGSQCGTAVALAQLEAENAELRHRTVEIALQIEILRETRTA